VKLSKYIAGLQVMLETHGDLECYYSIDEEGNGYHPVNYAGSPFFIHEHDVDDYYPDLLDIVSFEECGYKKEHFQKVFVVN